MSNTLSLTPSVKQDIALRDTHRYVGYGGARGGGKSWTVDVKAIIMAVQHPGIRQCIVRRSYPELRDNHITPLREMLPASIYSYNDQQKIITFKSGNSKKSKISFKYCANDGDLNVLQGLQYDIIYIDEATQFTEYQFRAIDATVRGVNNFPKRTYITCNPGGVGHGWVKRLFVDRNFTDDENPDDYSFIQALPTDNAALMAANPGYINQLRALPPKIRDAWLYGSWDIYFGQFFEDFVDDSDHYGDRKFTHVIAPFDIPSYWTIYRSFDFGYAKPFSFAWWAIDREGCLYRIREYYGCTSTPNEGIKISPEDMFRTARDIEQSDPNIRGRVQGGVADPAIWDVSRGESVAEIAARNGIQFTPGDNKRLNGWMQVHNRLAFDSNGYPMLYVFNTCRAFLRTIPLLCYDEHKPEDIDTTQEDHVADEVRYMCMSRPIKAPAAPPPKPVPQDDPLNMIRDKYQNRR